MCVVISAVGCHARLLDSRVGTISVAWVGIYCVRWTRRVGPLGLDNAGARRRRDAETKVWEAVGGVASYN